MSGKILPETSALPREPSSITPWQAMREYGDEAVKLWQISLSAWPFYFPQVRPEESDSNLPQEGSSSAVARVDMPRQNEEPAAPPQQSLPANGAESTNAEPKKTSQAHGKNRANGEKPARKHAPRQAVKDKKCPERTGPAVLAGLRNRSHSVKLAAVSAMTTNKKLRTQAAMPLLQRIVDNQTIQRRDPELRTVAKAVLQQRRRETSKRSPKSPLTGSPVGQKSHHGTKKG